MGNTIDWNVRVNEKSIGHKIENLINDEVMIAVHDLLAKLCNPYVPMNEGPLSQHMDVTPEYLRYAEKYAHYQYTGEIYGPNFPIKDKSGEIIGWYSQPGVKKQPTGRSITYNKERHALATHHWDKAMMRDKGDVFLEGVKQILIRRAKELYGG